MDYYIGSILQFAGNFAPRGFQSCEGQLMSISANTALYSILGTTYGGDGQSTFALPDLRGRTIIGQGQGPGLKNYVMGQKSGTETATLLISNMPAHNHVISLQCDNENAGESTPEGNYLGTGSNPIYSTASGQGVSMAPQTNAASVVGNGAPFSILNPYLAMMQCIATVGIFPTRG